jgi:hypothetical protein
VADSERDFAVPSRGGRHKAINQTHTPQDEFQKGFFLQYGDGRKSQSKNHGIPAGRLENFGAVGLEIRKRVGTRGSAGCRVFTFEQGRDHGFFKAFCPDTDPLRGKCPRFNALLVITIGPIAI